MAAVWTITTSVQDVTTKLSKRKLFLDDWARRGKAPSALPEDYSMATKKAAKKRKKPERMTPGAGALVFRGKVTRPEIFQDAGVLEDKTGQGRFEIMADVLEEFIGQRVEITIKPLD